jgi:hypothetical protein
MNNITRIKWDVPRSPTLQTQSFGEQAVAVFSWSVSVVHLKINSALLCTPLMRNVVIAHHFVLLALRALPQIRGRSNHCGS